MAHCHAISPGINPPRPRRTLLVGAESTIRPLIAAARNASQPLKILGLLLLHDGPATIGRHRVLGRIDEADRIADRHQPDLALISLPRSLSAAVDRLTGRLGQMGVEARLIPTIDDLLSEPGQRTAGFDVSRLLERPPHRLDKQAIAAVLTGRRVLITGAGGSIGSQLALLIARYKPAQLLLMERAENNLFEIQRLLAQSSRDVPTVTLLHDVVQAGRTLELCRTHAAEVIFHAAAHKHVPMMEDHPREAVINNFFGTKAIADAAAEVGAERFVMISTDKAVNPTSVMGATKRMAELYVQYLNAHSATAFTMVRFGNVLGSACSVVPIWTQQLAHGGPITVTDPRMTRYFMTIPEAAALVLQAGALPDADGQVMLLDMGQPIRIIDLAERFVRMHGLEPNRDIPIVFTGARPGEKLFEELAYDSEAMLATGHEAVRIWRTQPPAEGRIRWMLDRFGQLRLDGQPMEILEALREAVPEMKPLVTGAAAPAMPTRIARTA